MICKYIMRNKFKNFLKKYVKNKKEVNAAICDIEEMNKTIAKLSENIDVKLMAALIFAIRGKLLFEQKLENIQNRLK